MNKELARKNIRLGVTLFAVLILMMGAAFAWAALWSNYVQGA